MSLEQHALEFSCETCENPHSRMPGDFKIVAGGICAPRGFQASAVSCGVKNPASPRKDLALICSDAPTVAGAVFTTSKVKAAPVKVSAANCRSCTDVRAIIANSGNANACTGVAGIRDAKRMASVTASELGLESSQVLVCSTGIIGVPLPMDRIEPKIPKLVKKRSPKNGLLAAKAIMTSDTLPKSASFKVRLGKSTVRIGAMSKGAGMICPNMATMLCFVTTDARIDRGELKQATREAVELSFNRITVDGCMSTNDTVIVLANGEAGNRRITSGSPAARKFREALTQAMMVMARKIVSDGERVTKFVEVQVKGAPTFLDAKKVAEAVANSMLVKCSWNGNDPNWGRIMHAIGYSRARIREEVVEIYFDGRCACKHGIATDTPIRELERVVSRDGFTVLIDLNSGQAAYTVFTSDLSPEYVDFNRAEYSVATARRG